MTFTLSHFESVFFLKYIFRFFFSADKLYFSLFECFRGELMVALWTSKFHEKFLNLRLKTYRYADVYKKLNEKNPTPY